MPFHPEDTFYSTIKHAIKTNDFALPILTINIVIAGTWMLIDQLYSERVREERERERERVGERERLHLYFNTLLIMIFTLV
jgi:adenine-specific DNA methylase